MKYYVLLLQHFLDSVELKFKYSPYVLTAELAEYDGFIYTVQELGSHAAFEQFVHLLPPAVLLAGNNVASKAELNKHDYYVIPKAKIPEIASQIKDGDIICFIGSTKGLDITHVAIALWDNGKLTFMHASPKYGKAVIEPSGLAGYCNSIKSNVGIRVARLRF